MHVFVSVCSEVIWGGVGWGHVNLPCTSYVICCYAAEISGVVDTVYTRTAGVGFKEQRSSLVCEMLAMAICESTCSAPAKKHFNAETPGLKRQQKAPIKLIARELGQIWLIQMCVSL